MSEKPRRKAIEPETAYLIATAFCEGLMIPAKTTFMYVCRDVHQVDVGGFTYVEVLIALTLCLKPIYGYMSDTMPIFGQRRTPYLLMSALVSVAATMVIGLNQIIGVSLQPLIIAFLLIEAANNCRTVVNDAICVEIRRHLAARLEGLPKRFLDDSVYVMLWGKAIGSFVSLLLLMFVYNRLRSFYFLFYFCVSLASFTLSSIMHDVGASKVGARPSFCRAAIDSWNIVVEKRIIIPLIATTIILSAPIIQPMLNFFTKDVLELSNRELSARQLLMRICAFLAVSTRSLLFKDFNRARLLQLTAILNLLALLFGLFVVQHFSGKSKIGTFLFFLFTLVETYTSELRNVPLIESFAQHSPKSSDGFFMSMFGFAVSISRTLSAVFGNQLTRILHIHRTNFSNAPKLLIANILVGVSGFALLFFGRSLPSAEESNVSTEEPKLQSLEIQTKERKSESLHSEGQSEGYVRRRSDSINSELRSGEFTEETKDKSLIETKASKSGTAKTP